MLPERVRIVEVGPRDGLQNEAAPVPTAAKVEFVRGLVAAGLRDIEVTSFVHPRAVPQLADAEAVLGELSAAAGVTYSALVPNERGLDRALQSGIRRIAVFTAASETFTTKNIGMAIDESLRVFGRVIPRARAANMTVRAYLSTSFVCPFEGPIPVERVADLTQRLLAMGADEVSISDTIGAAAPTDVVQTVNHVLTTAPRERIALHFHDTHGMALANIYAGLQLGITTFDASAGGMGGCPFAPGAAGNVATEDVVHMLEKMGIQTGVRVKEVLEAAEPIGRILGKDFGSAQWRCRGGAHPMNR